MKLSKTTLDVLKNFSEINSGLLIEAGNVVRTKHPSDTIHAIYTSEEEFPNRVAIYDLNIFLGVISVFDSPNFDFRKECVVISEEYDPESENTILYCKPEFIVSANKINPPPFEICFELEKDVFGKIDKLARIQELDSYIFEGKDGKLFLRVGKEKNSESNSFVMKIGDNTYGKDFRCIFSTENFLFLPGHYTVSISTKRIAKFSHKDVALEYYVMAKFDK
jgi:hypothetical protein